MTHAAALPGTPRALRTILRAGVLAGTLDIGYVFVIYGPRGVAPARILKGIAAAVLGRDAALSGGWGVAALGLVMHFCVALTAAAVFYAASRKLSFLTQHALISGVAYGALVWLVMNAVVLPLTATPPKSFPPPQWGVIFLAHLICVGPPIALVVRHASRPSLTS